MPPSQLTCNLNSITRRKQCKIKGKGYAVGGPQQEYTRKIDTSSPIALLVTIMLTCMIVTFKKRDVATDDIPGAFMQTKMPRRENDVHVILYD